MLIRRSVAAFVLGHQFDHIVNAQDGDGGFRGELERFDLGDGRLEHAGFLVVSYHAFMEIQTRPGGEET